MAGKGDGEGKGDLIFVLGNGMHLKVVVVGGKEKLFFGGWIVTVFFGCFWKKRRAEPFFGILSQLAVYVPYVCARVAEKAANECDTVLAKGDGAVILLKIHKIAPPLLAMYAVRGGVYVRKRKIRKLRKRFRIFLWP